MIARCRSTVALISITARSRIGDTINTEVEAGISPQPPHKVMLTVTRNKVQLIDLICEDMAFHKDYFSQLVLTGRDPLPMEIKRGVIIKRQDIETTQEEADTMIVQQVAEVKAKQVLVVADDTDIFILLLHLYAAKVIFQLQPLY